VTLPNFGDERAIADCLRMADLNVPVLVQATPDTPGRMTIRDPPRQLLRKNGARAITSSSTHPVFPDHPAYGSTGFGRLREGPGRVAAVCRVVRGLRRLRIGAIARGRRVQHGAVQRENCWNAPGISVEPIDLSEILGVSSG